MKVVKVYGALRKLLGKSRFEFVAETPAQAMRALLANFPGLQQWLIDSEKKGVAYRVTVGRQRICDQDITGMLLPWSECEVFSIAPVMVGAGRGTGMFLLGAVLVATAIIAPGVGLFAGGALGFGVVAGATGFAAGLAAAAGTIGIGLMLTGVSQMISPAPKPIKSSTDAPTQLESNSFSGIANTTRQGVPVPIAYGRVFVGSSVISAGLDVDRIK